MHIHLISIFPEIFDSFLSTSLIEKACRSQKVTFFLHNPRDYTHDKHQQVDDEIYGWWAWLLMKAQPIIDILKELEHITSSPKTKVICLGPSQTIFDQWIAHTYSEKYDALIFICGRYEWFDHRLVLRCQKSFWERFSVISLGQFVTLWWEIPAMALCEAVVRLIPWVISDPESWKNESYRPEQWMSNLEYPQYTRPIEVEWFEVPEVLLSGHHKNIQDWRAWASDKIDI